MSRRPPQLHELQPRWLQRKVGKAHAFVAARRGVSCCGLNRHENSPQWLPAEPARRQCVACEAALKRMQRAAEARAAQGQQPDEEDGWP